MNSTTTILKSNSENPITLKDLRDMLNNIPEVNLNQPIRWWGEYKGGNVVSITQLNEDFINPSGDGCEPVSVYIDNDEDFDPESEHIELPKGSIMFDVD